MMRSVFCAIFMAAAAMAPRAAAAQTAMPEPGARVRVSLPSLHPAGDPVVYVGTLNAAEGDSLVVLPDGRTEPVVLRRREVRRVEVSQGEVPRGRTALRNGAVAGAVGAVVGGSLFALTYEEDEDDIGSLIDFSRGDVAVIGAVFTGGVAAAGGVLVGLLHRRERWAPVSLPEGATPSVAVRGDGGVRVGMTVKL